MVDRRVCLVALAVLALVGSSSSARTDWQEIDVIEHVLDNGFRMILVPRENGGMVHARIFHLEGSVHDPPGLAGMAHFYEHLLFEGTARIGTRDWEKEEPILNRLWELEAEIEKEKNRLAQERAHKNVEQISDRDFPLSMPLLEPSPRLMDLEAEHHQLLEARKQYNRPLDVNNSYYYWGDIVAFARTGVDATYYESFLPSPHLEAFFWIEADKFRPVFRNFYLARDTVQEQVLRWAIRPHTSFTRQMNELFFASTFGRYAGGGYELEQATRFEARAFTEKYLTPNNAHLVLVGEFDVDTARRLGETYFGRLERGDPPPRVRILESAPDGQKRLQVDGPGRPKIEVRFPIAPGATSDIAGLDLLSAVLNGSSGRLAERLGGEDDLVASALASRRSTRHYGYFSIEAVPRTNDALPAIESRLIALLETLSRTPVPSEELERARRALASEHLRLLADANALCLELGRQQVLSSWRDVLERPAGWESVTRDELQELAARTFRPERRTLGLYRQRESRP